MQRSLSFIATPCGFAPEDFFPTVVLSLVGFHPGMAANLKLKPRNRRFDFVHLQ